MIEIVGWVLLIGGLSVALGITTGRATRRWQESELAVDFGEAEDQFVIWPRYAIGQDVRTLVNYWPDGQLVGIGSHGIILAASAGYKEEPTYHIRWASGAITIIPESAFDTEIVLLQRAA